MSKGLFLGCSGEHQSQTNPKPTPKASDHSTLKAIPGMLPPFGSGLLRSCTLPLSGVKAELPIEQKWGQPHGWCTMATKKFIALPEQAAEISYRLASSGVFLFPDFFQVVDSTDTMIGLSVRGLDRKEWHQLELVTHQSGHSSHMLSSSSNAAASPRATSHQQQTLLTGLPLPSREGTLTVHPGIPGRCRLKTLLANFTLSRKTWARDQEGYNDQRPEAWQEEHTDFEPGRLGQGPNELQGGRECYSLQL